MDQRAVEVVRHAVRHEALWFEGGSAGLAALLEPMGQARLVLIGEASHGTDEFYRIRADLTAALVQQHGFNLIAVEADWPDAYRASRWVRHASPDSDAVAALGDFTRFPRWMWRNTAVVDFLTWLHAYNAAAPSIEERVGFFGLDLYSLHASVDAVLRYLATVDPDAARRARERYACFDEAGRDPQGYGYAASVGLTRSCEDEAVRQLVDLQRRAADYASRDGVVAAEEFFFAEQNARLVQNAEEYYRTMFGGRASSWNLRDSHMMETLQALMRWQGRGGRSPRAVVWAHNSHLGDARATQMSTYGEHNLGQLVRQEYGGEAFLLGFTTHAGTVTAARDWDEPAERRQVRPSMAGSWERLFHDVDLERFVLDLRSPVVRRALAEPRLERAIGVVYKPETERASHYFRADLIRQFDAVIHVDCTRALEPLEPWPVSEEDLPETYPTGV